MGKSAEKCGKWGKVTESGEKLGKVGKSRGNWGKVGKVGKVVKSSEVAKSWKK